jgi:hypothetical protein
MSGLATLKIRRAIMSGLYLRDVYLPAKHKPIVHTNNCSFTIDALSVGVNPSIPIETIAGV